MGKKAAGLAAICLVVIVTMAWQQVGQSAPALTALDYAEIEQLYVRYAVAVDSMANDGEMLAGVFIEENYESVMELVDRLQQRRAENGVANGPFHYVTHPLLLPTAEGAIGVAYLLEFADDTFNRAIYYDTLVKTPGGWRFKDRTVSRDGFPDELLQVLEQ